MSKQNTVKVSTIVCIACALLVPLWPISTPLFLWAAYVSYKGE